MLVVTAHAIARFRERVAYEGEALTDDAIAAIIRAAGAGPFMAALTPTTWDRSDPAARTWRYWYEGVHRGRGFLVFTDPAGDVARTVLDAATAWGKPHLAVYRRLPGGDTRRPSLPVRGRWQLVEARLF